MDVNTKIAIASAIFALVTIVVSVIFGLVQKAKAEEALQLSKEANAIATKANDRLDEKDAEEYAFKLENSLLLRVAKTSVNNFELLNVGTARLDNLKFTSDAVRTSPATSNFLEPKGKIELQLLRTGSIVATFLKVEGINTFTGNPFSETLSL